MEVRQRFTSVFRSLREKTKTVEEKVSVENVKRSLSARIPTKISNNGLTVSRHNLVGSDNNGKTPCHMCDDEVEDAGACACLNANQSSSSKRKSVLVKVKRRASTAFERARNSFRKRKKVKGTTSSLDNEPETELRRVQNETIWTLANNGHRSSVTIQRILDPQVGTNAGTDEANRGSETDGRGKPAKTKLTFRSSAKKLKKAVASGMTSWAESMAFPYVATSDDIFPATTPCFRCRQGRRLGDETGSSSGTCYTCSSYYRNHADLCQSMPLAW